LNPDQLKAVHTLRGPMLVLAGAGSGKTRVVTFRIRELIVHGTRADRILAVTFTNKAAREMLKRTTDLLKLRRGAPRPEVSTLHSLCVRILRRHAERLGYPKQFSICDRGDQETFARAALRNIRVDDQQLKPNDFLSLVGGWKSRGLNNEAALESADGDKQTLAALAYERYQAALRAQGSMDFDDLLLCTERLLREFPDVCAQEASRFDQVMIDEYQDTNASQYRIIRALALKHRNLCVVGDDDQSIYGWRGAEVQHILNFSKDWPEALVIRLEMNYRSREPILALANTLIANNGTRHGKVLQAFRTGGDAPRFLRFEDETAEAEAVVREIAHRCTREDEERVPPHHFAILFRTNEQPRAFELELRRNKVRYILVGGQSFFDRKEVRDIMAYLKLLAQPADEVSLLRVINTPSRGIGTSSIKALMDVAVKAGKPLGEILPQAIEEADLAPLICERISTFVRLIQTYRTRLATEKLSEAVRALIADINYKAELERLYKTPAEVEARYLTVDGVVKSIEEYEARTEEPSLASFLEETALAGRDDFGDDKDKQSGVTLMTLHSAKGLEFPHVYMVGMEEGLMPHRRVIAEGSGVEEERRLCYVGVTRAEDTLTMSLCKARNKWGKLRPSIPSRFLLEMRGENEKAAQAAEASQQAVHREQAAEAAAERAADEAAAKKKKKRSVGKSPASAARPATAAPAARSTVPTPAARPATPTSAPRPVTPTPAARPVTPTPAARPVASTPAARAATPTSAPRAPAPTAAARPSAAAGEWPAAPASLRSAASVAGARPTVPPSARPTVSLPRAKPPTPVGPPSGLGPLLGSRSAVPPGPPSGLGSLLGARPVAPPSSQPSPAGPPSGLAALLGSRAPAPAAGARPSASAPEARPNPSASVTRSDK
jgi:DNA helicase-2/ATP-dependent DNA helicase PcrA